MADLDPQLEDALGNLQVKQTALVEAMQNTQGVSSDANSLLESLGKRMRKVGDKESLLMRSIQRRSTAEAASLLSDFDSKTYVEGLLDTGSGVGVHDMWEVRRASKRKAWGPDGTLSDVSEDEPAFSYDHMTGKPLGISIDKNRTNDIRDSEGLSDFGTQRITKTLTTSVVCPTGGNVYALARTQDSSVCYSFLPGPRYKKGDNVVFTVYVNLNGYLDAGNIVKVWTGDGRILSGNSAYARAGRDSIEEFPDGWYRVQVRMVADKDGRLAASLVVPSSIPVGDEIYFSSPQSERGVEASTYKPTTGSSVTQEADVIERELGTEYNPEGFSIFAEAHQRSDIGSVVFLNSGGLSNSIRVGIPTNNDRAMYVTTNGVIQAAIKLSDFPGYAGDGKAKFVLTVNPQENKVSLTLNGSTQHRTVSEFPPLDTSRLGCIAGNNNNINGTISKYRMYQYPLTQQKAEEMAS